MASWKSLAAVLCLTCRCRCCFSQTEFSQQVSSSCRDVWLFQDICSQFIWEAVLDMWTGKVTPLTYLHLFMIKRLEGEVSVKQLVPQSQYLPINLVFTGLYSQEMLMRS